MSTRVSLPSVDFSFVSDIQVRQLIERFYSEARLAYQSEAFAGSIFLAGGTLEGMLTWALTSREEEAHAKRREFSNKYENNPLLDWDLTWLIKVAIGMKLLGEKAEGAAWAVKEFRNYIHPYNNLGKSDQLNHSVALGCLSAVSEIARSLRGRLGQETPPDTEQIPANWEMLLNFAWLDQGKLAGCMGPVTDQHLKYLTSAGIGVLVRLADTDEAKVTPEQVAYAGIEDHHEPVRDYKAPLQDQIDRVVQVVENAFKQGKAVAISCGAGCGRTSTLLACILVSEGYTADEAVGRVKTTGREPETQKQLNSIREFERRWKSGAVGQGEHT